MSSHLLEFNALYCILLSLTNSLPMRETNETQLRHRQMSSTATGTATAVSVSSFDYQRVAAVLCSAVVLHTLCALPPSIPLTPWRSLRSVAIHCSSRDQRRAHIRESLTRASRAARRRRTPPSRPSPFRCDATRRDPKRSEAMRYCVQ